MRLALGMRGADLFPLDAALGNGDGGALLRRHVLALLLLLAHTYPFTGRAALRSVQK